MKDYIKQPTSNRWHLQLSDEESNKATATAVFAQAYLPSDNVPSLPREVQRVIEKKTELAFQVVYVFSPFTFRNCIRVLHSFYEVRHPSFPDHMRPDNIETEALSRLVTRIPDGRLERAGLTDDVINDLLVEIPNPPQALIDYLNSPANGDGTNYEVANRMDSLLVGPEVTN